MTELGKMLIVFGGILVLLGLFLAMGGKVPWLGRLPGDIIVHRERFSLYFPLMTSLVVSVVLSLLFYLLRR
jgi:Protein of unknown function (DUF2905)